MIIGICGGSGSGKTVLVNNIIKLVGQNNICYLPFDAYYKDQSHLSPQKRIGLNFDHPEVMNFSLFNKHIDELRSGMIVEKPIYNFETHTVISQEKVYPKRIIITEGILLFNNITFVNKCDLKIFISVKSYTRLIRRVRRDTKERGRNIFSVIKQYRSTVKPMHDQFVEPSKKHAKIIVKYGGHNKKALNEIVGLIENLRERKIDLTYHIK